MAPPNSPHYEMARHRGYGLHMGSYMGELDRVSRNQQLRNIEHIESRTWRINFGGYENYEYGPLAAHRGYSPRHPPPSMHTATGGSSFPRMLPRPPAQLDIRPPNHHHGPLGPPSPPCSPPSSHHHGIPGPTSRLGIRPPDHHHCPPRPSSLPRLLQWDDLPVPTPRLGLPPPNHPHNSIGPTPPASHQHSPVNCYGCSSDENPNDCTTM